MTAAAGHGDDGFVVALIFFYEDTTYSYVENLARGIVVAEMDHNRSQSSHNTSGISMKDALKHCPIPANSRTLLSETYATITCNQISVILFFDKMRPFQSKTEFS